MGPFPEGDGPFFLRPFREKQPGKELPMISETIGEHLKRYHLGERNAVTGRELEAAFRVKSIEIRNMVNTLRREGVPIASRGSGYYYADAAQEVQNTIVQMTNRIVGIHAAIEGLKKSLELFDTGQTRLPLDGGGVEPP